MQLIENLNNIVGDIRTGITESADIKRAVYTDTLEDQATHAHTTRKPASEEAGPQTPARKQVHPRANFQFAFPSLPSQERLQALKHRTH